MIKVKISNFIKNNLGKIRDLGTKLIIVAIVVLVATIMLSSDSNYSDVEEDNINVYKPTETVIKGSNVSEEQYEKNSNTVEKFLDFCNNGQITEAYSLLTEDCKKEQYPTENDFKKYYQDVIFKNKRQYNMQAWITTGKYIVYKIRYTDNILETGSYNEENIYQDYITLNRYSDEEKISIGNFIYSEDCNIITNTDLVQATVTKKKINMSYEEYDITIKNNSEKTILLDTLENGLTINLFANDVRYTAFTNKLFVSNLKFEPGETKKVTIRFKKYLTSNNTSEKIEFSKVIKDYESYQQNKENYNDTASIKIKLEG